MRLCYTRVNIIPAPTCAVFLRLYPPSPTQLMLLPLLLWISRMDTCRFSTPSSQHRGRGDAAPITHNRVGSQSRLSAADNSCVCRGQIIASNNIDFSSWLKCPTNSQSKESSENSPTVFWYFHFFMMPGTSPRIHDSTLIVPIFRCLRAESVECQAQSGTSDDAVTGMSPGLPELRDTCAGMYRLSPVRDGTSLNRADEGPPLYSHFVLHSQFIEIHHSPQGGAEVPRPHFYQTRPRISRGTKLMDLCLLHWDCGDCWK